MAVILKLLVCILPLLTQAYAADVTIGNNCVSGTDTCTTANTECTVAVSGCDKKGTCACKSGYVNDAGTCKTIAAFDAACPATAKCTGANQECASGTTKCACITTTAHTYDTATSYCIPDAKKKLGGTCSAVGDCLDLTGSSVQCDTTCKCAAGYIQDADGLTCRAPKHGEACASVACATVGIADDVAPVCTSSKCTCATTVNTWALVFAGTTASTICQNKLATGTTAKALGETCTTSNECASYFCYTCPGDTKKCVSTPSASGSAAVQWCALTFMSAIMMMMAA